MKKMYRLCGVWLLLFFVLSSVVFAQQRNSIWYFGNQAGVSFTGNGPVALTNSALSSYEGCSSINSLTGALALYSDGDKAWDASHQLMPNGIGLGGHVSASQAVLILPDPGNTNQYYVLTVDAIDNNLVGGLRYSLVDMTLRAGLGDVVATKKAIQLPVPSAGGKVTEKLTATPHANGRDYWVVVHGWQNNSFYSFLVSATGISPVPVVSNAGPVHTGGGSFFGAGNAVGYMRISPSGTHLALAQRDAQYELYTFNNATGIVSSYQPLSRFNTYCYGVEFSPDNSKLYVTGYADGGFNTTICQYNLQAGSGGAIETSRQVVGSVAALAVPLQAGPDGKIYVSAFNRPFLHAIRQPNVLGTGCSFVQDIVPLNQRLGQNGLPNFPAKYNMAPSVAVNASTECLGNATTFSAVLTSVPANAVLKWNFGEPSSGVNNEATGVTPTHTYSSAGTFTVTAQAYASGATVPFASTTQTVTVNAAPSISLGPPRQLCDGQQLVLGAGTQPVGTTYRWQDGSSAATFVVRAAGTYTLTATSAQGCSSTSSTTVSVLPAPVVSLGRDTTLCLSEPLVLRVNPQPAGTTYQWQDGSTTATYSVLNPGAYSVTVTQPSGCTAKDDVLVSSGQCPFTIPNIITPNRDQQNQTFVLKGLNPAAWELTIFNRWGRQVYQNARYDNSWSAEGQPDGVYYYRLRNASTDQQHRGWVQVIR